MGRCIPSPKAQIQTAYTSHVLCEVMCQRNHRTVVEAYLIHDNDFLVMGPDFRRINGTNMVGVALWIIRASIHGFRCRGHTITAILGCVSCKWFFVWRDAIFMPCVTSL